MSAPPVTRNLQPATHDISVAVFDCDQRRHPKRRLFTAPCATLVVADDVARAQSERRRISLVFQGGRLVVWYHDGKEQFKELAANEFMRRALGMDRDQLLLSLSASDGKRAGVSCAVGRDSVEPRP